MSDDAKKRSQPMTRAQADYLTVLFSSDTEIANLNQEGMAFKLTAFVAAQVGDSTRSEKLQDDVRRIESEIEKRMQAHEQTARDSA